MEPFPKEARLRLRLNTGRISSTPEARDRRRGPAQWKNTRRRCRSGAGRTCVRVALTRKRGVGSSRDSFYRRLREGRTQECPRRPADERPRWVAQGRTNDVSNVATTARSPGRPRPAERRSRKSRTWTTTTAGGPGPQTRSNGTITLYPSGF